MIMLLELTRLGTDERSWNQGVGDNGDLSLSEGVAFSFSQNIAATHWQKEEI